MSNGNTAIPVSPVVDIIRTLQEGEAAKAKVPELESALSQKSNALDSAQFHNQRLEENILGYKNQIADLISKVRSLEGERDDASFRVLETEDKFDKLKQAIRHATGDLDATLMQVDPPKAEPVAAEVAKGPSEPSPTSAPVATASTEAPTAVAGSVESPAASNYQPFTPPSPDANPSEGSQSKPDPTMSPVADSTQGSVAGQSATGQESVSTHKTEPGPDTFNPSNPDTWWKDPQRS